ncbi:sugar transferase [bacterium]|jgi:lipopolysaccharide/colanic/teichoic acid biosynthesis glycosyltransferase|nr:sugar transferase [bacterium]
MSYIAFKVAFDYLVSLILLFLLFPILLLIAILIKVSSKGPIFYLGDRVGKNLKIFKIIKFRTMIMNAELVGGLVTSDNDSRITNIGRFLRKYKFDELPQFFNILRGEMSLVGPRPEASRFVDLYSQAEKESILSVKPGITDLSSIEFIQLGKTVGSDDNNEDFQKEINKVLKRKLELRLEYVNNRSFLFDIKILFLTFCRLFNFK